MVTLATETPPADAGAEGLLAALVERARAGDMHAWARLYQDHWARLLRHVAYLTGDATMAEDLVQEAFAQALASLARYDARAPFFAWLRGIALNVVRKHWRTRGRRSRAYTRLEAQGGSTTGGSGRPGPSGSSWTGGVASR